MRPIPGHQFALVILGLCAALYLSAASMSGDFTTVALQAAPVLGIVGIVALVTWWRSRNENHADNETSYLARTSKPQERTSRPVIVTVAVIGAGVGLLAATVIALTSPDPLALMLPVVALLGAGVLVLAMARRK